MLLQTVVFSALVFAATAQKTIDVQACDVSGNGKLKSITVTPCTTVPCQLKKGSEVTFGFTYISDQDSEWVKLSGTIAGPFGIKIPIPGLVSDFCTVVNCPVQKDKTYTESFKMKIGRVPISKTTVEMRVTGTAGLSACFKFPVTLV